MLKRVAILANGGDVSGFNAVIRAIVKTAEEKIERICKFPESGTLEPLLKDEEFTYRFVHIQKRIKLIYRFDERQQTIFIVDVWNTKMLPQHLLDRMKQP